MRREQLRESAQQAAAFELAASKNKGKVFVGASVLSEIKDLWKNTLKKLFYYNFYYFVICVSGDNIPDNKRF